MDMFIELFIRALPQWIHLSGQTSNIIEISFNNSVKL